LKIPLYLHRILWIVSQEQWESRMKYLYTCILLVMMPVAAVQAASLYSSVRDGLDLFEQKKYEEALETFLEAQVDNPESAVLKFDIASCQYRLQKYDEAAAGYLDVVATARDAGLEAQALYNLGNTMYRQGKLEDAVEYYKKTLELNPEDEDARKNLEFVREEIKRRMNEAKDTQKRQQEGQKDDKQDQQNQQGQQQGQQDAQRDAQQDEGQGAQQESRQQDSGQGNSQQSQPDSQQEEQGQQEQGSPDGKQDEGMQDSRGQSGRQDGSRSERESAGDLSEGARPMSDEEAEQWLRGLEENPEKLQEFRRRSLPGQRRRPEKDW
jgi:Ca-activated chloride channel family protein